jgi:glycosyltransferase involved in cell wall biosynthesis
MTTSTTTAPLISIVVPSFNHAQYLAETLDSILSQDYRPLEIWVADGGSKDGTVELLERYAQRHPEVHFISEPDRGPADAVNKGLARVTGDIIGIQSSDDVYYPGAFRAVAGMFAAHPDCGFVYGDIDGIDQEGRVLYSRYFPEFSWPAFFGVSCCLAQSSIFFRASVARAAGGWRPDIYGCDLDYWMRLAFRTRPLHIARTLSGWRRYEGQRTRPDQYRRIWDDYWKMIDTSPEIAAAPPDVQRLARASKHLLAMRAPPSESAWTARKHVAIGAWLHPGFWRYNPVAVVGAQLPGFNSARLLYRKLRGKHGQTLPPRHAGLPSSIGNTP